MASGDHCLIRRAANGEFYVVHYECDDHPDATVTDGMTGEIIKPK